jgi:ribosomal protein RSM22 (predicted rRNA methylase)
MQRERERLEGKRGLLVPLEGQQEEMFHVMRDPAVQEQVDDLEAAEQDHARDAQMAEAEVEEHLRKEAYHWPRLVYPPIKRSGHVLMDTCHPSGESDLGSCRMSVR